MLRHERNAPIWLFSFVDLAFLLLIAFTQIGPDSPGTHPELAELEIPTISGPGTPFVRSTEAPAWHLRVYPPVETSSGTPAVRPYALLEPQRGTEGGDATAIDAGELKAHLELLRDRASAKPILAPHPDSRSEDLLVAVSLLEEIWTSGRTVAVRPESAVASGPTHDKP